MASTISLVNVEAHGCVLCRLVAFTAALIAENLSFFPDEASRQPVRLMPRSKKMLLQLVGKIEPQNLEKHLRFLDFAGTAIPLK